jgi:hypothetical protein
MTTKKEIKVKGELAITRTYDLEKPVEAVQMAVLLKNLVIQQNLYASIKGKNYVMVEGFQLAGFLTGLNVIVDEPKSLSTGTEIKYSCTAKIYKGELLVGVGYAICSSKEASKKGFDEYAICSMAQTRAIGKAYRNKIGFIMKLAGFQPTPSEEMHKVDESPKEPLNTTISHPSEPQVAKEGQVKGPNGEYVYVCSKCDDIISEVVADYSMKVYKKRLCNNCPK